MNELTLTLMKVAFLAVLWLFVIAAVGVIRADLFGSKAATKAPKAKKPKKRAVPAAQPAPARPRSPQPSGRFMPTKLVVTAGPIAGTSLSLADVPITIGRGDDATLMIGDDYASGRHARLFSQNGQWFVEDLGSTNGTYLGRAKVVPAQPQPIPQGVPIHIGKTVIELRT